MDAQFQVTISATAEVRDADGNLVSAEPVEATMQVSAEELAALRATMPHNVFKESQ